jgi:hypothetical protein
MPGDQQEVARRDDLLFGELIARLLDVDQRRHQIIAGIAAPARDQFPQVPTQPPAGLKHFVETVGRLPGERDDRVQRRREQR